MLTSMAFGLLTLFFECLMGELNYFSQYAARSRSVKGRYQGHRGQFCNFIGKKGTNSTNYLSKNEVKWSEKSTKLLTKLSLVTDTIYIFTVAKQGFLGNFGPGIFIKSFLVKVICQK